MENLESNSRMRPFTRNLVHYNWHWHWDYGNGDVGNQGIHETDLCMWGLGVQSLPERITSMGGKFLWDDCKQVPEIQTSIYHYPKERKIIQIEVRNWCTNVEDGAGVGNISHPMGKQLEFDPVAKRFIGDAESEANSILTRDYRAPYLLPEIV